MGQFLKWNCYNSKWKLGHYKLSKRMWYSMVMFCTWDLLRWWILSGKQVYQMGEGRVSIWRCPVWIATSFRALHPNFPEWWAVQVWFALLASVGAICKFITMNLEWENYDSTCEVGCKNYQCRVDLPLKRQLVLYPLSMCDEIVLLLSDTSNFNWFSRHTICSF